MNKMTFLDPIFDGLRILLVDRLDSFADQLRVPAEWLIQFLDSNAQADAEAPTGVARIANALLQLALFAGCCPEMSMPEVIQYKSGSDVPLTYEDRRLSELLNYSGKLNSYYDLFSALSLSEMIGKPDDWASPDSSSRPLTKAAFKQYIRLTVPEENHRLIFGEAA